MKIDCQLVPGAPLSLAPKDSLFVVIDVLRATSTIVTAFMNGCRAVVPVAEVEEAIQLAHSTMAGSLVGGERGGLAIDGFDLGNSPLEYSPTRVRGRTIILTTTNGTRAFRSIPENTLGIAGSFLNLGAVARYCLGHKRDVVLLPAGGNGMFSLEDVVCAGGIVETILAQQQQNSQATDAARASAILHGHFRGNLVEMARSSSHGEYLMEIGMVDDLEYCTRIDLADVVPLYRNGLIRWPAHEKTIL